MHSEHKLAGKRLHLSVNRHSHQGKFAGTAVQLNHKRECKHALIPRNVIRTWLLIRERIVGWAEAQWVLRGRKVLQNISLTAVQHYGWMLMTFCLNKTFKAITSFIVCDQPTRTMETSLNYHGNKSMFSLETSLLFHLIPPHSIILGYLLNAYTDERFAGFFCFIL